MTAELIFAPDGEVRGLWTDRFDLRRVGLMPARASRVEVVQEGPHRGRFHVDFTPIAELTNNSTLAVCLVTTFASHDAAVQAEQSWLHYAFIMPPVDAREEKGPARAQTKNRKERDARATAAGEAQPRPLGGTDPESRADRSHGQKPLGHDQQRDA